MAEDYAGWSLPELKAAAAAVDTSGLARDAGTLRGGSRQLDAVVERFDAAVAALAGDWTGAAARAAAANASDTITTATGTRTTAAGAGSSIDDYSDAVRRTRQEVAAIPDEHFSWGAALAGGALAGPLGVGLAAFGQHREAERHRAHAAELVARLDADGHAHAAGMAAQPWVRGIDLQDVPEPLPAADAGPAQPIDRAATRRPSRTGEQHEPQRADASSTNVDHPTQPDRTAPASRRRHRPHAAATRTPEHGRPSIGSVEVPATEVAAALVVPSEDVGGAVPAENTAAPACDHPTAAAAAAFDPAGGGRAADEGSTAGDRAGRDAAGPNMAPGADRASAGPVFPTTPRSPATPAPRAGVDLPSTVARGGLPMPVAEGTVAAPGGYPVGGPTRSRDDEDELRERPEYLIESDDIWGDGRTAAPPVLG